MRHDLEESQRPYAPPRQGPAPKAAASHRPERFPISPGAKEFRRQFFPRASRGDWNDWRWQARNRIRSLPELERIFVLSPPERTAVARIEGSLPLGITPYYASLFDRDDAMDPLRRTHIPLLDEFIVSRGESEDPLAEEQDAPVPGLVHRYPDRVLFLTTGFCSTYCRYCTRARMVGTVGEYSFGLAQWERALAYIAEHRHIRDVLLSGGDPLTLADERLEWLLKRLRTIPHLEFLRIGTKIPFVLPQRVTKRLARMLARYRIWISLHATHPDELTPEATEACDRLADVGIPLGSQTVLLRGINDDAEIMRRLMHGLLMRRVRPYYLYQCDPIAGSAHFRTSIAKGLEIISSLRGHTTGYACPSFVVDAPGGGGKIQLLPDAIIGREENDILLRNFEGQVFRYPDPGIDTGASARFGAAPQAKLDEIIEFSAATTRSSASSI